MYVCTDDVYLYIIKKTTTKLGSLLSPAGL